MDSKPIDLDKEMLLGVVCTRPFSLPLLLLFFRSNYQQGQNHLEVVLLEPYAVGDDLPLWEETNDDWCLVAAETGLGESDKLWR